MKKKVLSILLVLAMCFSMLTACGGSGGTGSDDAKESKSESDDDTVELSMWFWGATSEQQEAMSKHLVDKFNEAHPGFHMTVEYRSSVNKDMAVALSADEGPDVV